MRLLPLQRVIEQVEYDYASFYQIDLLCTVNDYLLEPSAKELGDGQAQGGVYFLEDGDDVDIGLHIAPSIRAALVDRDPLQQLTSRNLNAFCVLIEEISHFHLLLDRKAKNQTVSMVELEWQAEIDKLLFSAAALYAQNAFAHYHHLFRIIYDNAQIVTHPALYMEATKYAARMWSKLVNQPGIDNPAKSKRLQAILQKTYRATWQEKLEAIEKLVANA